MFVRQFIFVIGLVFLSVFSVQADLGKITGGSQYEIPTWFTDSFLDLTEDAEDALDSHKTVLLYFHLDGCPYCDAMLEQNFKGGENLEFIKKYFSVIEVNIKGAREITMSDTESKTEQELSKILKVEYTPTVVFLGDTGKQVFRTNGYRAPKAFRDTLEYVANKAYQNSTLSDYVESRKKMDEGYAFIDHSNLRQVSFLRDYTQPVAILFEDKDCLECVDFHQKLINRDDVKAELDKYLFIRFDAYSDQKIIDFNNKMTSPRQMVKDYDLNYRPGILLFNEGENIAKIDGQLYSFHFNTMLKYVSGKHYEQYMTFGEYLNKRQDELLEQGVDISIVD